MAEISVNTEKKTDNATSTTGRVTKGGSEGGNKSGDSGSRGGYKSGNRGGDIGSRSGDSGSRGGYRGGSRSGDSRGRSGFGGRGGFGGGGFRGDSRGNVVDLKRRVRRFDMEKAAWVPKTEIGKKVANGEIKSIDEILEKNIRIKEPEIIEKLLPNLEEEILENKRVQRVTTNGRVMRFKVIMAVGDGDGHIGIGQGKAKEVPIAIQQAVRAAKLNLIKINRGCGSWFCNCGKQHTIPITMVGTSGSVNVKLVPATGGLGLVAGEVTKKVLSLAGIKDVWSWSSGHTRTSLNLAQATVDALVKCKEMKK